MSEPDKYIKYLPWDSDFFGYKVGEMLQDLPLNQMSEALTFAQHGGYRLVYFKTDRDDTILHLTALKNKGIFADQKVTYGMHLVDKLPVETTNLEVLDTPVLTPELLDIVLQTGVFSRFNTDANFGKTKYEALYRLWIERSLKKELADEVIFYTENKIVLGYLTLKFNHTLGQISLVGVDSGQQRKGIGKFLLAKAVNLSIDHACDTLEVATQRANDRACRFYENFGFGIYKTENIYHFWL